MKKLSDYIEKTIDNRGRNPKQYFSCEKYPVIDNYLIKNTLYPDTGAVNRYIDEDTFENFLRGYVHKNMPLMTLVGNGIGNVTLAPCDDVAIIQNTVGFQCKEDLDEIFLYYYLLYQQEVIKRFDRGSGQPSIKKTDLLAMNVDFPELAVQEQIRDILLCIDEKIEVNKSINNNLEQQTQAIFENWFLMYEPFNFSKPDNWISVTLGSVCKCVLGGTPSRNKPEFWNGNIPWINSGEINNFRITNPSELITELGRSKSATKLLPAKTTVLAITGATLGQVSLLEIDSCANQSVVGIIPNKTLPYEFIYPFIKHNINELISHQTGGAQQHINKQNVESLSMIIPTNDVMEKYVSIVSGMYAAISNNCFENERLISMRDNLLPKLMQGELDVSNLDI